MFTESLHECNLSFCNVDTFYLFRKESKDALSQRKNNMDRMSCSKFWGWTKMRFTVVCLSFNCHHVDSLNSFCFTEWLYMIAPRNSMERLRMIPPPRNPSVISHQRELSLCQGSTDSCCVSCPTLRCQFPVSWLLSRSCWYLRLSTVPRREWNPSLELNVHWESNINKSLNKLLFRYLKKTPSLLLKVLSGYKESLISNIWCNWEPEKIWFYPK